MHGGFDGVTVRVDAVDDQLSSGPPRPGRSSRIAAGAAALAVALALGFAAGSWWRAHQSAAVAPSINAPVSGATLVATGRRCAQQVGDMLWLGVEVANDGPAPAVLRTAEIDLPLDGLAVGLIVWTVCGELGILVGQERGGPTGEPTLPADATLWVSAIFENVLVDCPAPYPVAFRVSYTSRGVRLVEQDVGGFVDLGRVPYDGCYPD
jgi:hypothetical protein